MALVVDRLLLPEVHYRQMLAHVLHCLPEEGCGLLGGQLCDQSDGKVSVCSQAVLTVTNQLHSPVRFRMSPEEQFRAFQWFEAHALELIAIFHSHPAGPDRPSATDLAEFAYPGVLNLIWSPVSDRWQLRAFRINEKQVDEVEVWRSNSDDFTAGASNGSPAEGL